MKRALGCTLAVMLITDVLHFSEAQATRDISRYATRGPYVLHEHVITPEDRELIDDQMRDFLWNCWQDHRLGRLITVQFSIEGARTCTTYFVEPDESGRWHVVVETIAGSPAVVPGTSEHREVRRTTIATIESVSGGQGKRHIRIVSGVRTLLEL